MLTSKTKRVKFAAFVVSIVDNLSLLQHINYIYHLYIYHFGYRNVMFKRQMLITAYNIYTTFAFRIEDVLHQRIFF